MYRVLKKWIINDDPVEKGSTMLKEGQKPRLKSLTVRYPEGEPRTLEAEQNEKDKSAIVVYFRIIQMLTDRVVGEERMRKALLEKKGYAFEKVDYESKLQENPFDAKSHHRRLLFSNLPEIYIYTKLSSRDIASRLHAIVDDLEKSERSEQFPKLEVLCEVNDPDANDESNTDGKTGADGERPGKCPFGLNTILFGPPGTGKTYHSRTYAVAIAENLDPDWVEKNLPYEKQEDGSPSICAEYEALEKAGRVRMVTFHQAYGYEEFIQGIRPVMKEKAEAEDKDTPQELSYEIRTGVFKKFCEEAADDLENRYIFLIDEINRGNIAKIFGELITLIEPSKRKGAEEALSVRLPYNEEPFSVPSNVYLLGTMNTADRSLALLDTALRRRFDFVEMMPKPDLLSGVKVEGIDVKTLLENLNTRLELLIDREHTIGHAFFLPLKKDPSIENLARIMKQKVIPLLQEFFYDDYGLMRQVLGGTIVKKRTDLEALKSRLERSSRKLAEIYTINYDALTKPEAYQELLVKEPADE